MPRLISDNPVLAVTAAGEIGFWVVLAATYLGVTVAFGHSTQLTIVPVVWLIGWPVWVTFGGSTGSGEPSRDSGQRAHGG